MRNFFAFLTLVSLSLSGFAAEKAKGNWSLYGSDVSEAEVNLSKAEIHSYKLGSNSYTDINIYAGYNRFMKDNFQLGGEGGILSVRDTATSNKSVLAAMGVLTYNLDRDFSNSAFGKVGVGLQPAYDKDKGDYNSKFSFMFDAGKRVALWNHVAYKPFIRLMKRGDMDMEFLIQALNFSFFY